MEHYMILASTVLFTSVWNQQNVPRIRVFREMMLWHCVSISWHFKGWQSLRNVGDCLPIDTASYRRRLVSSRYPTPLIESGSCTIGPSVLHTALDLEELGRRQGSNDQWRYSRIHDRHQGWQTWSSEQTSSVHAGYATSTQHLCCWLLLLWGPQFHQCCKFLNFSWHQKVSTGSGRISSVYYH